jgi:hypothetical protein
LRFENFEFAFSLGSLGMPDFADVKFDGKDNLHPFANSLTLTCDDFSNAQHKDNDQIAVAYGMWWASESVNDGHSSENREKYRFSENAQHSSVKGGAFLWGEHGAAVNFER